MKRKRFADSQETLSAGGFENFPRTEASFPREQDQPRGTRTHAPPPPTLTMPRGREVDWAGLPSHLLSHRTTVHTELFEKICIEAQEPQSECEIGLCVPPKVNKRTMDRTIVLRLYSARTIGDRISDLLDTKAWRSSIRGQPRKWISIAHCALRS